MKKKKKIVYTENDIWGYLGLNPEWQKKVRRELNIKLINGVYLSSDFKKLCNYYFEKNDIH